MTLNTSSPNAFHASKRFQHKRDLILRLCDSNADFLSLCEDYEVCVNAFNYWGHLEVPGALTKASEYHDIMGELEKEICQALAAVDK